MPTIAMIPIETTPANKLRTTEVFRTRIEMKRDSPELPRGLPSMPPPPRVAPSSVPNATTADTAKMASAQRKDAMKLRFLMCTHLRKKTAIRRLRPSCPTS